MSIKSCNQKLLECNECIKSLNQKIPEIQKNDSKYAYFYFKIKEADEQINELLEFLKELETNVEDNDNNFGEMFKDDIKSKKNHSQFMTDFLPIMTLYNFYQCQKN